MVLNFYASKNQGNNAVSNVIKNQIQSLRLVAFSSAVIVHFSGEKNEDTLSEFRIE